MVPELFDARFRFRAVRFRAVRCPKPSTRAMPHRDHNNPQHPDHKQQSTAPRPQQSTAPSALLSRDRPDLRSTRVPAHSAPASLQHPQRLVPPARSLEPLRPQPLEFAAKKRLRRRHAVCGVKFVKSRRIKSQHVGSSHSTSDQATSGQIDKTRGLLQRQGIHGPGLYGALPLHSSIRRSGCRRRWSVRGGGHVLVYMCCRRRHSLPLAARLTVKAAAEPLVRGALSVLRAAVRPMLAAVRVHWRRARGAVAPMWWPRVARWQRVCRAVASLQWRCLPPCRGAGTTVRAMLRLRSSCTDVGATGHVPALLRLRSSCPGAAGHVPALLRLRSSCPGAAGHVPALLRLRSSCPGAAGHVPALLRL